MKKDEILEKVLDQFTENDRGWFVSAENEVIARKLTRGYWYDKDWNLIRFILEGDDNMAPSNPPAHLIYIEPRMDLGDFLSENLEDFKSKEEAIEHFYECDYFDEHVVKNFEEIIKEQI